MSFGLVSRSGNMVFIYLVINIIFFNLYMVTLTTVSLFRVEKRNGF